MTTSGDKVLYNLWPQIKAYEGKLSLFKTRANVLADDHLQLTLLGKLPGVIVREYLCPFRTLTRDLTGVLAKGVHSTTRRNPYEPYIATANYRIWLFIFSERDVPTYRGGCCRCN